MGIWQSEVTPTFSATPPACGAGVRHRLLDPFCKHPDLTGDLKNPVKGLAAWFATVISGSRLMSSP